MKPAWLIIGLLLGACATKSTFYPKSEYPPDPWVKGYSDPDDCLGGEKLAAVSFELPDYPRRAFNGGIQGWTIVTLDVTADGATDNVEIERAVPEGLFGGASKDAVRNWQFEPPEGGALQNCRVLIRYRFGRVSLGS